MDWLKGKKTVVPVDFSNESVEAVDFAVEVTSDESDIHVIHVAADLLIMEPGMVWDEMNDATRELKLLEALREKFPHEKYNRLTLYIAFGDAGHEIAEYAEQIGAGVIILPSHGRTGLTRVLIGSTAERVVRLAHCPVLVLKKEAKK